MANPSDGNQQPATSFPTAWVHPSEPPLAPLEADAAPATEPPAAPPTAPAPTALTPTALTPSALTPTPQPVDSGARGGRSPWSRASLALNCLAVIALIVGAFFYFHQRSVLNDNERSAGANSKAAIVLKNEVERLQKVNATMEKSLAAAAKAKTSAASEQLDQMKTVIQGVATELDQCASVIREAAARTTEFILNDPQTVGAKVRTILGACEQISEHASDAAKALDG